VHDVAAVRDYLLVRSALRDGADPGLQLAEDLRREPV
jgi:hypothetical protein